MGKLKKILPAIVWDIQVAAELMMVFFVVRLNLLPGSYLVFVLGGGLLAVTVLTGFLLLKRPKKHTDGIPLQQIIGMIIALVVVVGGIVASVMAYRARTAIEVITEEPEEEQVLVTHMGVYVKNDSNINSVMDIPAEDYGFLAIYNEDWNAKAKVYIEDELLGKHAELEEVEEVVEEPTLFDELFGKKEEPVEEEPEPTISISTKDLDSIFTMADELYAGTTNVIVMDDSYVDVLSDVGTADEEAETENPYANFATDTKKILDIPIYGEPSEVVEKDITSDPFIIYVSGSDTRSATLSTARSDVNILAIVNPVTHQVLMINTPRDTYVKNPAGGNAMDKLTHCGIYGIENSMQALGQFYGCDVDHYVQVNFSGFETIIDSLGGITVDNDMSFKSWRYGGTYSFSEGPIELNGASAQAYVRERFSVAGGDETRGRHQMMVIEAIIKKVSEDPTTVLSNYSSLLSALEGMIATDFSADDISALVKLELSELATWDVKTYAISGVGDSAPNYSMSGVNSYVMHPDSDDVTHAKKLISKIMMGETLSDTDLEKEAPTEEPSAQSTEGTY
ncbi:MAG: LCP family protein [Lachnospiraceae bacterium]|nr:LCP family protein [Lachnospiraceae bacterium]